MPDLDNALVREKTRYYVARPDYLQRIVDRSRLYLYHIVEEIEKRGMPTELALLPMVESAFNPMAYSRAHASGLWQFIPGTGKRFDLEQNWWYDARRDIVESTNAALDYLTKLYEMHGDWQLALASYNWGENAVARAIAKNRAAGKPTDYASLKMPAETRHYIPKLQALKNIIANPEPLGIVLGPIPNQPYFAAVTKLRDIDVQLAARLAEMPVAEFIALNPGFSRPYIRAAMTPRIVLPADKVDVFHDNLTALGDKSLVSWKTYHPKQGETFESIARKHGMTLGQLKEVNGIAPRNKAVPRLLVVPTKADSAHRRDQRAAAADHVRAADPGDHAPRVPHREEGRDPGLDRQPLQGLGGGPEALERRQPGDRRQDPGARGASRPRPRQEAAKTKASAESSGRPRPFRPPPGAGCSPTSSSSAPARAGRSPRCGCPSSPSRDAPSRAPPRCRA